MSASPSIDPDASARLRTISMGAVSVTLSIAAVTAALVLLGIEYRLEPLHTMELWLLPALLAAASALLSNPGRIRVLAICALVGVLVVPALASPTQDVGDWPEYYLYQRAFMNHVTPDYRPADIAEYVADARREGMGLTTGINFEAPSGRVYSYHFWLSSMLTAPFGVALKVVGLSPMRAFALLNALLIGMAFCALAFRSNVPPSVSKALAAFWMLSPVTWYIGWPSAEVFTASMVAMATVAATRRRYPLAVLLAALGATQNAPVLVVVGLLCLVAIADAVTSLRWLPLAPTALFACVGFAPNVFYLATFDTANLIMLNGEAMPSLISAQRVASLYLDLNQGMLPYVPGLVLLWVPATLIAAKRRSVLGLSLSAACLAMTVLSAMGADWGSGSVGLMRWAVWQVPVLVWAVMESIRTSTHRDGLLAGLVVAQLAVALTTIVWPAYTPDYLHHGPLATLALNHFPSLYRPEPDIFYDRTTHHEVSDSGLNTWALPSEVVIYRDRTGRARKALFPSYLAEDAAAATGTRPDQVNRAMYDAGRVDLYYLDLPLRKQ